jgi:hypothetical protein
VNWDIAQHGLDCKPLPRWTPLPGDPAPLRRELAQLAGDENAPDDEPLPPPPSE